MRMKQILADLRNNPTVPVWPHYAKLMNLSRGSAYASVKRGDVPTVEVGRLIRVISAPLRKKLGLDNRMSAA